MLKNREEIKSIQILRAIAVLGVFYYHFANARERCGGVFPLFGSFGVDIFFIISGFIIGYMVSKTTEKFFIKRIVRILPLYIIATSLVILSVLLFPQLVYTTKIGFTEFIKSILFIPYKNEYRNGPILEVGWTLNFEMLFYLIMYVCIIITKNRKYLTILCGIFLIITLIVSNIFNFDVCGDYDDGLLVEFIYGLSLFHIYKAFNKRRNYITQNNILLAGLIALTSILYLIISDIYQFRFINNRNIYYGLPAFIFAISVLSLEPIIKETKKIQFCLKLGEVSYVIYLFHQLICLFLSRIIFPKLFGNVNNLYTEFVIACSHYFCYFDLA